MTLYAELVSEWIDSIPITAHVSDRMDHIYADHIPVVFSQKQHKEEFKHRRICECGRFNSYWRENGERIIISPAFRSKSKTNTSG